MDLSVSVVIYQSPSEVLDRTLNSLADALAELRQRRAAATAQLALIDNAGPGQGRAIVQSAIGSRLRGVLERLDVLDDQGNVGYGRGHNLAMATSDATYHLILNPDVIMERGALVEALTFLDNTTEAGLLVPYTASSSGQQEFLCRRYPTVLDLALRGFLPRRWQTMFGARLARYELRSESSQGSPLWDPLLVSGCFMLFRNTVLKRVGGFDPRYFLYFEDYDLSLRAAAVTRIIFLPSVRIIHFGGNAARKGFGHIRLFLASAWTFFGTHGWKLW